MSGLLWGIKMDFGPIEAVDKIIAGMPDPPEIIRAGSKAFLLA